MENATKAMLIAAGVLMGVMILSLGIALYLELNNYVESTYEGMRFTELNKFNSQFTKYINYIENEKKFDITIQDIISIANLAHENNINYNANTDERGKEDSLYVAVYLNGTPIEHNIHEDATELLNTELQSSKTNMKTQYKCTNDSIKYSALTHRVFEIYFISE